MDGSRGEVESLGLEVQGNMTPREMAMALPRASGVYLMRDGKGTIIYVGKAKDLRRRVTSYFLAGRAAKTAALVRKIATIDHIITGNEYEALVLENNLIKKYNPHYNISLKDGKSYPMIRITNEPFPKVFKTRRLVDDGSLYYGPYPDAGKLDLFIDLIQKLFPLRRCSIPLRKREKPCLYYHMGLCRGPCAGLIDSASYKVYIDEVRKLLKGSSQSLEAKIRGEMEAAAKKLDFEEAARKRDILRSLLAVGQEQEVQDFVEESRDYAAIEMRPPLCTVSILQMRSGRLIGRALYRAETFGDETETLMNFLVQYYADGRKLPRHLYVSHEIDSALISRFFEEELHGLSLEVSVPLDGRHYRVLRMAAENARSDVEKRLKSRDNSAALALLAAELGLAEPPRLIEGFDIAHLMGRDTVASLITFRDGNPDRGGYRLFTIRSLNGGIDDYESMREATARRYSRVLNENLERPGLVLVDGGKGQVNAVREILDGLGLTEIPVIGLAEELEEIVFDDDRPSLKLDLSDEGLRILIAMRDECHRVATTANRRMRSTEASFKVLESIDGVGPKRSRLLMEKFGTLEKMMEKDEKTLAKEGGVPLAVAKRILHTLRL